MGKRGDRVLVRRGRWLRPLIARLLEAFPGGIRPPVARVAAFIGDDHGFQRAWQDSASRPGGTPGIALSGRRQPLPVMAPAPGAAAHSALPSIVSPLALPH